MGEEEREKLCLRCDREWVLDEVSTKLGLERWAGFCQEAKHCPSSNPLSSTFTICGFLFYFQVTIFFIISFFFLPWLFYWKCTWARYASWGKQEVKNHGDELHCGICEWVLAVYTLEATIRAKHLLKLLSIRQTRCNQVKGYRPWAKQQRKKPSVEIIF